MTKSFLAYHGEKFEAFARKTLNDFSKLESHIISLIRGIKSDDDFIKRLSRPDFFTSNYSSMDKNYFFWKYENYLRDKEQPVATPMSHDDLNEKKDKRLTLTIEHIVAQRNSDEQSRVINPSLPVSVGRAKQFNEMYLNSIGNLTIDPQSANSSKGKSDVNTKNSKYFIVAPYKCQNELNSFMEGDKWTIRSICNRTEKLIGFAKSTWCDFAGYAKEGDSIDVTSIESDTDTDVGIELQEEYNVEE